MQYYASFEPFEIFEEFNGVPGTYIKSFLISDKINLNDWQATHEANVSNLDSFIGRPGIHYISPEGKLDHTSATSFEKSLQLQELYRAANIISVGCDVSTKKCWQFSKVTNDDVASKIKSKEIKWISPSIWPEENSVEQIVKTDGTVIDVVHDYKGLHYAFVDEPAYGDDADIKSFCDGTTKQCQTELAKFNASIDNVNSINDKKIIISNSSGQPPDTSHNIKSTQKKPMATEDELRKENEELKKALKATEEENQKLKDKEAKKATEEDQKDQENKDSKKATDEDKKEENKEVSALKAQVEQLTKKPLVEKIVSSQLSAGIITSEQASDLTAKLSGESISQLNARLETSKSFEAKLTSYQHNTSSSIQSVPYFGSVNNDTSSFDASLDEIDDEKLLMEVSNL